MEGGAHRGLSPPAYFLGGLVAVVVLSVAVPGAALPGPPFQAAGVVLIAFGVWLNVRGSRQFERTGRPIRPGSRGGGLVTDGVFRLSRNPMYLGMAMILLGAALALQSAVGLLATPLFVWVVGRRFIAMEERILEDEFGDDYRLYRGQVRRWI